MLALSILVADLVSKGWIFDLVTRSLDHGEQTYWIFDHWFGLVKVYNRGGPWGMGSDHAEILKIIRIIALGIILYILMGTPVKLRMQVTALAMVMGGALGNIWDSCKFGHVRDFLYFELGFWPCDPWPAFNLADSMICVGVFLLAISLLLHPQPAPQRKEDGLEDSSST